MMAASTCKCLWLSPPRCSWMTLGETQILCCPFQYLMRLRACSVETISSVRIADISESCLIEIAPLCDCRMERSTCAQYERYETIPRSESGRSGVPTLPSFRESSYEKEMRKRP